MQQSSPACNEEGVWKSVFITSHSSHPHTSSYGSQCATTTTIDKLWKSQEAFRILMHAVEVLTSSIYLNIQYLPACVCHTSHVFPNLCSEIIWNTRTF